MKEATLCLLVRDGEILLVMKKRGFGAGKWNGAGGKVKQGESPRSAVLREAREEICVHIRDENLIDAGYIQFRSGLPDLNWNMHVYRVSAWEGEVAESEEMAPQWFAFKDIPYEKMWPDDTYWMPHFLEGKKFEGEFFFAPDGETILEQRLVLV